MAIVHLDQLPSGAAIVTRSGNIHALNFNLAEMTGIPPNGFDGLLLIDFVHPDDRPWVLDMLAELAMGHSARSDFCTRLQKPDGASTWCLVSAFPYRGGDGLFKGLLLIVQDMSIEKEMLDEMLIEREQHLAGYPPV